VRDFEELKERYYQNAEFHAVVSMLEKQVLSGKMTPYEIRDAAFLASILADMKNPWMNREIVLERQAMADLLGTISRKP
jgi:hypothetical protein